MESLACLGMVDTAGAEVGRRKRACNFLGIGFAICNIWNLFTNSFDWRSVWSNSGPAGGLIIR